MGAPFLCPRVKFLWEFLITIGFNGLCEKGRVTAFSSRHNFVPMGHWPVVDANIINQAGPEGSDFKVVEEGKFTGEDLTSLVAIVFNGLCE